MFPGGLEEEVENCKANGMQYDRLLIPDKVNTLFR